MYVESRGQDDVPPIRHGVRCLVEQSRAEIVVLELPLASPVCGYVAEQLEADGLGFTSIGPHFSPQGDVVKLTYLVSPLEREPIKTYEPFTARLVEYALAEQIHARDCKRRLRRAVGLRHAPLAATEWLTLVRQLREGGMVQ